MNLLTAEGLTFRSPEDVLVLDGIHFALRAGEVVDVVGPSGSGKTTFLRALARLLPGSSGMLRLSGSPSADIPSTEWRTRVALVPQAPAIIPGSVRDNLLAPWRLKARAGVAPPDDVSLVEALGSVGLDTIALDRDAARLSVGQAARVALLRVVLTGPGIVLLDEPDAALDDESAAQVAAITRTSAERGIGIVRVRHGRSDVLAERRLRLADGRLTEVCA